jgi:hypothetical protein
MLSPFDDYAIHQTPDPVAQPASGDRNAYDRYWLNGYTDDGEFYFGLGAAVYPNRQVMDCGFSIVRDGEQHAFHASRRAPSDPSHTEIGPFRLEVIEPMRQVRLTIAPNDTDIECDLHFNARTACIEEGRQTMRQAGRVIMDSTRFTQFGRWQGEIRYAGQTVPVDATRVYGTKDRSWGIRPVGEPPGGAPNTRGPQIFFLWAPIQWADRCSHFIVFEDETGHPWHQGGMIVPAYATPAEIPGVEDAATVRMRGVDHRVQYVPGTRRAGAATLGLIERGGERHQIELEPLLCFRMKGIGYTHMQWGHGVWQGELAVAGESWKTADLDPMAIDNQHIQQVVRATWGDEQGVGVLEQIALGPHETYGFKELLDPA